MNAPTQAPPAPPAAPANGASKPKAAPPNIGRAKASIQPPRMVLAAVEGWGKTSCGAHTKEPFLLMARGETGYTTLLGAGLVPQVDTLVDDDGKPTTTDSWQQTMDTLGWLADQETDHKTIVLDALGGFERLCHEHVCRRDFNGDWGEKGFTSYQKGYDVSVTDWIGLLSLLDRLHQQGRTILVLSHYQVKPYQNPVGENYDRLVPDIHHKTWAPTVKWTDAVLSGQFRTIVQKDSPNARKGKGIGGTDRVCFTERRDAYDAKNRYGMPEEIEIPNDPTAIWTTIRDAMTRKDN